MVASFLYYLQYEKRYSPHTLISYQTDLEQLSSYLITTYQLEEPQNATYQMIRSWLFSLAGGGLQPKSLARKMASIKSYYKFLFRKEYIVVNPCIRLRSPKLEKRLPVFVREEELNMQLNYSAAEASDFSTYRNLLILEMLYGTGMRLSELIGLKEKDFNRYDGTLKVVGKGNKERLIPANTTLKPLIYTYFDEKSKAGITSDHLLVTDKGEPLYPVFVQRLVKKYFNEAGLKADKKSPHVFRHSFATHMLNRGADLTAIKDLLGHSSLAATQVYTHNSFEKLKEAFAKAHPKA